MAKTFLIRAPKEIYQEITGLASKEGITMSEAVIKIFEKHKYGKSKPSDIKVESKQPEPEKPVKEVETSNKPLSLYDQLKADGFDESEIPFRQLESGNYRCELCLKENNKRVYLKSERGLLLHLRREHDLDFT